MKSVQTAAPAAPGPGRTNRANRPLYSIFAVLLLGAAGLCSAQTTPPTGPPATGPVDGSLVDLINSGQYAFNVLERASATANQASYNELTANPAGAVYCNPLATAPTSTCPAAVFLVFSNLRTLVQTANALLGNGQATRYSLNISDQALGFALRWTAAEELSAPGSTATQFTNAQFASLASRITALRFGASGFTVSGLQLQPSDAPSLASNATYSQGGGASADDIGIASRWGGFLNGSYGYGQRAPSALEDAFAYDSRDATLGVDYRFSRSLVAGVAAGYTNQRIDFNSTLSVVGGGIRANGFNVQAYALYDWDSGLYVSGSVGGQRLNFATTRLITYPSFNIAVPSVNATASGSTDSNSLTSTFAVGWLLSSGGFGFEPYLNANYQHVRLAGYHESSVNNSGPEAGQAAGFDFDYAAQRFASLDTAFGNRFQYAFKPPFGAAVLYVKAEYHHLFDDSPTAVVSSYNAIAGGDAQFNIPGDKPDSSFFQFAAGTSFVFKHGIQAFLQYQTSAGIAYVSSHVISGGLRGEF